MNSKFTSITSFTNCTLFAASGDFVDNSYRKCKLPTNEPLAPHSVRLFLIVILLDSKF